MADDEAKRSDGGTVAPTNPLSHNVASSKPETVKISLEDCYDPQDLIFNSSLLHWETVLLGDEIKSAPPVKAGREPDARAEDKSGIAPKEEAVLPAASPEEKPPAKHPSASEDLPDLAVNQPDQSRSEANRSEKKSGQAPASERAKPAARAAVKPVSKPAVSAEETEKAALEMEEIAPPAEIGDYAADVSEATSETLRTSFDAGHGDEPKKSSGLFGRLFSGVKKAATGAVAVSAAAKAAETVLTETAMASGTVAVEALKSETEVAAPTPAAEKPVPTAKTERVATAEKPAPKAKTERTATAEKPTPTEKTERVATAEKPVPTEKTESAATAEKPAPKAKTERTASAAKAKKPDSTSAATTEASVSTPKAERTSTTHPLTPTASPDRTSTATMERPAPAKREQADFTSTKTVTAGAMKPAAMRHAKPAKRATERPISASNSLYRYFYFTGIQLMRSIRKRRRRLAGFVGEERQWLAENRAKHRRSVKATRHVRKMELHIPFADLREKYKIFAIDLKNARQYGSMGATLKVFTQMSGFVLKNIWRVLSVVLNYAAPIAACILVALYVSRETAATMALKVEYNGVDIGYIADESVFTNAANDMKSRMILGDVYVADPTNDDETKVTYAERQTAEELARSKSLIVPRYTLMPVNPNEILTADELTNSLIKAAGRSDGNPDGFAIEEADGLYIDNYYIGAVTDGQDLLDMMSTMLDEYVTDIEETDGPIKAQFVKKVQVKRGLYPTNSIRPLGEIQTLLGQEASGTRQYIVVSGDTPLRIAAKNGISFDELKVLNPNVETNLQPGDTLLIAKSAPYLGVKISKTIKYEEAVKYSIIQKVDKNRAIGYNATTQRGSEGLNEITAEVVMVDGVETERNILDTRVITKPVDQIVQIGGTRKVTVIPSDSSGQVSSGAFAWPAPVHVIGTGFLGYYGHTGSDIVWGGCYGSPIYASAGGVVVASGWGGAYGNRIVIDHGGGVQTLYAHCSQLNVGVGTIVSQGQTIAAIGRTGNVTGPHLHFEIRINGTPVNPARYLY